MLKEKVFVNKKGRSFNRPFLHQLEIINSCVCFVPLLLIL